MVDEPFLVVGQLGRGGHALLGPGRRRPGRRRRRTTARPRRRRPRGACRVAASMVVHRTPRGVQLDVATDPQSDAWRATSGPCSSRQYRWNSLSLMSWRRRRQKMSFTMSASPWGCDVTGPRGVAPCCHEPPRPEARTGTVCRPVRSTTGPGWDATPAADASKPSSSGSGPRPAMVPEAPWQALVGARGRGRWSFMAGVCYLLSVRTGRAAPGAGGRRDPQGGPGPSPRPPGPSVPGWCRCGAGRRGPRPLTGPGPQGPGRWVRSSTHYNRVPEPPWSPTAQRARAPSPQIHRLPPRSQASDAVGGRRSSTPARRPS